MLMGIALILFSIPMFLIFFWLGVILAVFGLISKIGRAHV